MARAKKRKPKAPQFASPVLSAFAAMAMRNPQFEERDHLRRAAQLRLIEAINGPDAKLPPWLMDQLPLPRSLPRHIPRADLPRINRPELYPFI